MTTHTDIETRFELLLITLLENGAIDDEQFRNHAEERTIRLAEAFKVKPPVPISILKDTQRLCPKCNLPNDHDANYCISCGKLLDEKPKMANPEPITMLHVEPVKTSHTSGLISEAGVLVPSQPLSVVTPDGIIRDANGKEYINCSDCGKPLPYSLSTEHLKKHKWRCDKRMRTWTFCPTCNKPVKNMGLSLHHYRKHTNNTRKQKMNAILAKARKIKTKKLRGEKQVTVENTIKKEPEHESEIKAITPQRTYATRRLTNGNLWCDACQMEVSGAAQENHLLTSVHLQSEKQWRKAGAMLGVVQLTK